MKESDFNNLDPGFAMSARMETRVAVLEDVNGLWDSSDSDSA